MNTERCEVFNIIDMYYYKESMLTILPVSVTSRCHKNNICSKVRRDIITLISGRSEYLNHPLGLTL